MFKLIKTWKLPVSMLIGVAIYYIIKALPITEATEDVVYGTTSHVVQPCLIFSMLFLSFLKVEPRDMRPHRWHGMLLFTQAAFMVACALLAVSVDHIPSSTDGGWQQAKIIIEGAMLCFICPTATASAVIVQKLGGSLSGCASYLILCNLLVALIAPSLLTMVEPSPMGVLEGAFLIMGKVFPLLLCPLFAALIVRHYAPKLMNMMLRVKDLAFYLWLVALALAITVTVRTIMNSDVEFGTLTWLAFVSLICCLVQFGLGRHIGRKYGHQPSDMLTAGQAFGQKNTVFIIWLGLVFLNPVTSVVGGFYSVWHNVINSWQLYKAKKQ